MSYTPGYKKPPSSAGYKPKKPIRPGNFFTPPYQTSTDWTERTAPERVQVPVAEEWIPYALSVPGGALEAPIKFGWELAKFMTGGALGHLENDKGQSPMEQLAIWIGDVTPIGEASRMVSGALDQSSKAQNAIYNNTEAAMIPKLVSLPDSTVITANMVPALISRGPLPGQMPEANPWVGKTVREFKQNLADRGFNAEFKDDAVRLMSWQEVSDIVTNDELLGSYQFGHATISTSPITQMAYSVATDPLNLAFGAGSALKILRLGRVGATARAVEEAQLALEASKNVLGTAQRAHRSTKAAREALHEAEVIAQHAIERAQATTPLWSQKPYFKPVVQRAGALRQVWGVGYVEDVARLGLRVARMPSARQSAEAMATSGTAQAGSLRGVAHLMDNTRFLLSTEKPTSPFMTYYRTGLTLELGSKAVELGSGFLSDRLKTGEGEDNNVVSGFLSNLHDAAYEINNKHILSDNSVFMLTSIWLLPTVPALKANLRMLKPAALPEAPVLRVWMDAGLEPTYKGGLSLADSKAAEKTFLARWHGGADGFAAAREFMIARIAFKKYIDQNPKLKLTIASFEQQTRLKLMAEKLRPMIDDLKREGKVDEKQLAREWIEYSTTHGRSLTDEMGNLKTDVPREVAFDLTPEEMIQQWNTYLQAMNRLHDIMDPRLEATIVRADRMGREAIDDTIHALVLLAKNRDGKIDSRVLQSWLSRTQAMFEDAGMNPAFWERYMSEGVAKGPKGDFMVDAAPIIDELTKVRDNAVPDSELFHEAIADEAAAADSPITITDYGDNSPLTPEGVRLVQSQADVDVVSIEQNVPYAAAQRVRLRLEQVKRNTFTSKGLPKVPAQWAFNRTIRRHAPDILDRIVKSTRPRSPKAAVVKRVKAPIPMQLGDIEQFVDPTPNTVVLNKVHHLNAQTLRDNIPLLGKPGISEELRLDSDMGNQVFIVARNSKGEIDGILAIEPDSIGYRDIYVRRTARGQGVATSLYDKAQDLGYDIKDVTNTTADGKAFRAAYDARPPREPVSPDTFAEPLPSDAPLRLIDPKTGKANSHGNSGYQVGRHPGAFSLLMPDDAEGLVQTLQTIRRYHQDSEVSVVQDEMGRLALEPSVHVKTLDEAMQVARQTNQQYIWDHKAKKSIEVEYPPDAPRLEPDGGPAWENPGPMPLDVGEFVNEQKALHPWWNEVYRGLSLGHLTTADLMDMGLTVTRAEGMTEMVGLTQRYAPVESLPQTLYHTTTANGAVRREGLASAQVLHAEGTNAAGLGGSPMMVSFTDARVSAELIERDYHTLVDLLQGRRSPMDLHDELAIIAEAQATVTPYWVNETMQSFLYEVNHSLGVIKHGFTKENSSGVRTVESELADLFKEYLHVREAIGGSPNPIFVEVGQSLADKFRFVDPKDIAVLEVTPRPGAQGFHRMDGAISEWRTWHGDAVEVKGGARRRYSLEDAEKVARRKWDEHLASLNAQIAGRRAIEKDLKAQWKALKKESDELRMLHIHKNWFDRFNGGKAEFTLDELRHLKKLQEEIEGDYPNQYTVGPAPKVIQPWRAEDGPLQALFVERSLLKNILFDYGPLGRLTHMIDFLTEPVSAAKMVVDSRRAYEKYMLAHGAKPNEIRRYLSILMEKTKEGTLGPSDAPIYRGATALPESYLRKTAHDVYSAKTIASVEKMYNGRWAAPINMAYNSMIRRTERMIIAGGKSGMLGRAVNGAYSRFHTTKGLGAAAEGLRFVSKVFYPLFRFTIDVRWQAMNYLEADILALGYDGFRSTSLFGKPNNVVRHGRKDLDLSQQAEALHGARGQRARVPGHSGMIDISTAEAAGVFQTHKRMGPAFMRQGNLHREANITAVIDALPKTGPEYANLVKKFGEDPRTWSKQIEDMLYSYDKKGVEFSIRHEAELARRGEGWTPEEWIQMQPMISRLIEMNQKSFDDLVQLHIGNLDRSRIERLLNSYWLYWPIGYQLKAGRWLMKTMFNGPGKNNMLGAYQIDRWTKSFKDFLVVSPGFAKQFVDNEALWFAAAMFLPLTPFDVGVSLNRGVRYFGGNVAHLWPEYDGIDSPFDAIQRMISLGPIYTIQLLDAVGQSGYVQELLPDDPDTGATPTR